MKLRGRFVAIICCFAVFCFAYSSFAQMTSTNYEIQWDSITAGGDDTSSSTSYILRDSVDFSAGSGTSTNYGLNSGYRAGVYDRTAEFQIYLQDRSTQVATTAVAGQVVTLASTAGFSANQIIVLVQNEGASQVEAIGKVLSVDPILSQITTDAWQVGAGGIPTIDGSNDYIYILNSSAVSLGTLTTSAISTSLIAWEVSAEVDDGYSVYVYENNGLTNGTDTISDVSDGSVSAGSSEYGARASDTSLSLSSFDTQDTGITTSLQQVGSRSTEKFDTRDFITLKTAICGSETDGTYSHTLTLLYVGDY